MQLSEQIIEKCRHNDRKAQKVLYDCYAAAMLGICIRYCKNKNEAEDVLQEAFYKIFTHIDQYRGDGPFEAWMKRIVVNTAINHYHALKSHMVEDDITQVHEYLPEIAITPSQGYTADELLKVINSLPQGYKMVFNLYAIEGYKHSEIAAMLGIDENTSKSQYSRAKALIRQKLEVMDAIARPETNQTE